jgi:hypothetical protein
MAINRTLGSRKNRRDDCQVGDWIGYAEVPSWERSAEDHTFRSLAGAVPGPPFEFSPVELTEDGATVRAWLRVA